MARVKLYESTAKQLLFPGQPVLAATTATTKSQITKFAGDHNLGRFVVKVDQGIKKRGKRGLVAVDLDAAGVISHIRKWGDEWSNFIVEPFLPHESVAEHYLSFERARHGWRVLQSDRGGVDVESGWDSVRSIDPAKFASLITLLDRYHFAFLEINPYLMDGDKLIALDAAAEVDDAALNLAELASSGIIPVAEKLKTKSENAVASLDGSTPASLKFRLLNPGGSIWMLLSGGGASLVLADEVADVGLGSELANYGEYSGAPSDDDTYAYGRIILRDLLNAKPVKPRVLIIAGGVANFTDVAKTFKGLIRALDEVKSGLAKVQVRVFVRRGGPNEKKGLDLMEKFLSSSSLLGSVHGHDTPLTQVVADAVEFLSRGNSSTDLPAEALAKEGVSSNTRVGLPKVGEVSPRESK